LPQLRGHEVRVRRPLAVFLLLWSGGLAVAERVPLPLPRPAQLGHDAAPVPEPPAASVCRLALTAIAVFKPLPLVDGAGGCGIADPVSLEAVLLADGSRVVVKPAATLRCDMARAVSQWLREEVATMAAALGAPLAGIDNFDSYSCRGRNRVVGAKLSEHGRGNALDIRAMRLASGRIATLTDPFVARHVRESLRKSTCERFTTVLGPGSDGYHENHIHVDLAQRRSGYRLCQWDVRGPPDPVWAGPPVTAASARRGSTGRGAAAPARLPMRRPERHGVRG
jgi:hypothetical protein